MENFGHFLEYIFKIFTPWGVAEISDESFYGLCCFAASGKTAEVLAAVDLDPRLANRKHDGRTLLTSACCDSDDNPQLIEGLLKRGSNIHARSKDGYDALMFASSRGNIDVCTILLDHGADPNAASNDQLCRALYSACFDGHFEVALLLISRGANLMLIMRGDRIPYEIGRYHDEKTKQCCDSLKDAFYIVRTGNEEFLLLFKDALRRFRLCSRLRR
jgi:ankyrin repeat protein